MEDGEALYPMRGADEDRCFLDAGFRGGSDHRSPEVDVRRGEAATEGALQDLLMVADPPVDYFS